MPWDMYDERAHVENLVNARLNFLVVFYSVIIAGVMAARSQVEQSIVLTLGTTIVIMSAIAVHRAHAKLDTILKIIYGKGNGIGPLPETQEEFRLRPLHQQGLRATAIVGLWIPLFCSVTLLVGTFASWLGLLPAV